MANKTQILKNPIGRKQQPLKNYYLGLFRYPFAEEHKNRLWRTLHEYYPDKEPSMFTNHTECNSQLNEIKAVHSESLKRGKKKDYGIMETQIVLIPLPHKLTKKTL